MPCYHPLAAYQLQTGGPLRFSKTSFPNGARRLEVPCGQCIGCRLEYCRQWAVRCMNEAKMHERNCFVTLTYDDKHLPENLSLDHSHFVGFFKRLRERLRCSWINAGRVGVKPDIRFFMGGEYGERFSRPHYHAIIFGYYPDDASLWKRGDSGHDIFTSKYLDSVWKLGQVFVGNVSFQSASYVARYCLKKVKDGSPVREILDVFSGEVIHRAHEYGRMSLRPGIGASFIQKYAKDIFLNDRLVVDGAIAPLPRYYDNLLDRYSPLMLAENKAKRRDRAVARELRVAELHPELPIGSYSRLRTEEVVKKAAINLLKRGD